MRALWFIVFGMILGGHAHANSSNEVAFVLGASQSPEVSPYGGTNYYMGIGMSGLWRESSFWFAQLRGDSLGKDSVGVKKDRVSWMGGAGHTWNSVSASLGVGLIDTMTTVSFDPSKTVIDPFTGVTLSSDESGISHSVLVGYMGTFAVEMAHWDALILRGEAAYFNTVNASPYADYYSLGLNLGMVF